MTRKPGNWVEKHRVLALLLLVVAVFALDLLGLILLFDYGTGQAIRQAAIFAVIFGIGMAVLERLLRNRLKPDGN